MNFEEGESTVIKSVRPVSASTAETSGEVLITRPKLRVREHAELAAIPAELTQPPEYDEPLEYGTKSHRVIVPTPGSRNAESSIDGHDHQKHPEKIESPAHPILAQQTMVRSGDAVSSSTGATQLLENYVDSLSVNGVTTILTASSTLVTLMVKLRQSVKYQKVGQLYRHLVEQLKKFEARCKKAGVAQEKVVAARYILCASLDDAVLNSPWGVSSVWAQHPLLSVFHREKNGADKAFRVLDRLMSSPEKNLELIELYYICIKCGFEGKYRFRPQGAFELEQLLENLSSIILSARGEVPSELSPNWKSYTEEGQDLVQYVPMWVITSMTAVGMLLVFAVFSWWNHSLTQDVIERIDEVILLPSSDPAPSMP